MSIKLLNMHLENPKSLPVGLGKKIKNYHSFSANVQLAKLISTLEQTANAFHLLNQVL